jgi:hypothetical protein
MPRKPLRYLTDLARRLRREEGTASRTEALFAASLDLPPLRRAMPELARELDRARRYQRPLAVVVLGLDADPPPPTALVKKDNGSNGNGSVGDGHSLLQAAKVLSLILGSLLRQVMRESDLITYSAVDDRYLILLTESKSGEAREAVRRLDGLFFQKTLAHLRAGIAEFPGDGLILEDLIEKARCAWETRPVGEESAPSRHVETARGNASRDAVATAVDGPRPPVEKI